MPVAAALLHCAGEGGKLNWLYARPVPGAERCVVFFPGDLSDFAKGQGLPYCYSLEALFWVVCLKFPADTVVMVRPLEMKGNLAMYANFMVVDSIGQPECQDGLAPRAVRHLNGLLGSLGSALGSTVPDRIVLVGFSKGATVLGGLLREAADEPGFWQTVEHVHFVDASLKVPGTVFPAGSASLLALSDALRGVPAGKFKLWLHSTDHPSKPFLEEETNAFQQRCTDAGLPVERVRYGKDAQPGVNRHFDSLRCFDTGDQDEDSGDQHCGFFGDWFALG